MIVTIAWEGHSRDVECPDPLTNAAGRVDVLGTRVRVKVALTPAMRPRSYKGTVVHATTAKPDGETVLYPYAGTGAGAGAWPRSKKNQYISLTGRPDLAALAANYDAITGAIADATVALRRAAAAAVTVVSDAELMDAMHDEAARYVCLIPDDHVRVKVTHRYGYDNDDDYKYEVEGLVLRWDTPGLTHHGAAYATRHGALNPFAREVVKSIPRSALDALHLATMPPDLAAIFRARLEAADSGGGDDNDDQPGQPVLGGQGRLRDVGEGGRAAGRE